MELTADQRSLLIVGLVFLGIVAVWAWTLSVRANVLLRDIRDRVDPELWESLGAPATIRAAIADPERRWIRFVRSGEYRRRLASDVVDLIDDFRQRQNRMLIIIGVAAALIGYRYWPLLAASLS